MPNFPFKEVRKKMNAQKLTSEQYEMVNQSVPAMRARGTSSFGDILNALFLMGGKTIPYTSNGTANTQDTVAHNLGYVPQGYIVINNGNGGVVYTGAAADATNLRLKCTTASNACTLLVF